MSAGDFMVRLDDNVLDSIAGLICGNEDTEYYRQGYKIEKFFRAAGWANVGEFDGYRRDWALTRLRERRNDSDALRAVLLRLADPREYIDDDQVWKAVVTELNRLLAYEGLRVVQEGGRPVLRRHDPTGDRITAETPLELTASIAEIVRDTTFGAQLQGRMHEAHVCWRAGAPTAAIIMLGSVLEGVLYDVALNRLEGGRKPTDHLERLIITARENRWIGPEVADYAEVLRGHRNLVHPKKQWTGSYAPEGDVVRIAWNVVVAALNDLATPLPRS